MAVFMGVALAMVAIPAPMVRRMVTLPRRLHPRTQPHQPLANNPTRNQDKPAQG
jgi:hypothetical protein